MMTSENLGRVLVAEKYEKLRKFKCAKSFCINPFRANKG